MLSITPTQMWGLGHPHPPISYIYNLSFHNSSGAGGGGRCGYCYWCFSNKAAPQQSVAGVKIYEVQYTYQDTEKGYAIS